MALKFSFAEKFPRFESRCLENVGIDLDALIVSFRTCSADFSEISDGVLEDGFSIEVTLAGSGLGLLFTASARVFRIGHAGAIAKNM